MALRWALVLGSSRGFRARQASSARRSWWLSRSSSSDTSEATNESE
eukprot:CAMPEP_0172629686 /NCGR_PEP_ID=MMETSP1068-20121228/169334_1 /TAXON_ID=35684 /ORGANISM="Pseudopedinella elastica, Strain CCMP716" /LENGTH=45 /DNA_ID= /DNA_START= /DNA_END= /DNA_ORIENTATION=